MRDQDFARYQAQQFATQNSADADPVLLDLNEDNQPYGDIIVGRYTYNPEDNKSYFFCYDPLAADPIPVNALAVMTFRTQDRQELGGPVPLLGYGNRLQAHCAGLRDFSQTPRLSLLQPEGTLYKVPA